MTNIHCFLLLKSEDLLYDSILNIISWAVEKL